MLPSLAWIIIAVAPPAPTSLFDCYITVTNSMIIFLRLSHARGARLSGLKKEKKMDSSDFDCFRLATF